MRDDIMNKGHRLGAFYFPDIRKKGIAGIDDALIEIVKDIHRSTWCATDGCCQGHAEPRAGQTKPYSKLAVMTFVFHKVRLPLFYSDMHEAMEQVTNDWHSAGRDIPRPVFRSMLYKNKHQDFRRVAITIDDDGEISDDERRSFGRQVFARFARRLVVSDDDVGRKFELPLE